MHLTRDAEKRAAGKMDQIFGPAEAKAAVKTATSS
jgi:hypothetical protein